MRPTQNELDNISTPPLCSHQYKLEEKDGDMPFIPLALTFFIRKKSIIQNSQNKNFNFFSFAFVQLVYYE